MRTFQYDTANRLVQVVSGTLTTQCAYSGDGVRSSQTVEGVTTRYVNDVAAPLPQVLREDQAGAQTTYLHGLGMVGRYDSGTWAYHHPDALGSVRQMTDAAGQVTLAQSYSPFGIPTRVEGQPAGSLGFAGEQQDPSTGSGQSAASGLIYLRARYYDPATGQFLTRDTYPALAPVPQSLHRYVYCGNDPVNRTDPSGEWWWDELEQKAEEAWQQVTRPLRRTEQQVEQWGRRAGETVGRWQENPRRELGRVVARAGEAITEYSTRKQAELSSDVHNVASAVERRNWEGAASSGVVCLLHLTGITDVRVTRNVAAGMLGTTSPNRSNTPTATSPPSRTPGSRSGRRSGTGHRGRRPVGLDIPTMGGFSDIRYGAQEGDWLRVTSGVAQVLPGVGALDATLDTMVAGRMVGAESVTLTLAYTYNSDGLRVAQSVDGVETAFT